MIKIISMLVYSFLVVNARFNEQTPSLDAKPVSENNLQRIAHKNVFIYKYVSDFCDELDLLRHPKLNISFIILSRPEVSSMSMEEVNNFFLAPEQEEIIRCPFKSEWIGCVYNIHYYQVNITEIHRYADANSSKELLQKAFHVLSIPCENLQPTYFFVYVAKRGMIACFFLYILRTCCYSNRRFFKRLFYHQASR